jgi:hypothetical protein
MRARLVPVWAAARAVALAGVLPGALVGALFGALFGALVVGSAACERGAGREAPARVETRPAGAASSSSARTWSQHAYVWQRAWTDDLRVAVAAPPAAVDTLRVLAHELPSAASSSSSSSYSSSSSSAPPARIDVTVDVGTLARSGRDVVVVLRIDGARLPAAPAATAALAALGATAARWRAGGARVVGVELDHDSATAALVDYARFLQQARPPGERLAITALPTWADDPAALRALAAVVDDVVLQVHAVRAPVLFDAVDARAAVDRFLAALGRAVLVAVPTYRVTLADGRVAQAEPAVVAPFARALRDGVDASTHAADGVVWFRLGHDGDRDAWGPATWRTAVAVVDGEAPIDALQPRVAARLRGVDATGDGLGDDVTEGGDVVVHNDGAVDAWGPDRIDVDVADGGAVIALGAVRGYAVATDGHALVTAHPPRLRPGAALVVGFVRGSGVSLVAR